MKLLHLIFLFHLGFSLHSYSQSIDREVVNVAGGYLQGGRLSLSISMGQSGMAGTQRNKDIELKIGFQQPVSHTSTGISNLHSITDCQVFPNPFDRTFYLTLEAKNFGLLTYRLYDRAGVAIQDPVTLQTQPGSLKLQIDTDQIPAGMFYVEIFVIDVAGKMDYFSLPVMKI